MNRRRFSQFARFAIAAAELAILPVNAAPTCRVIETRVISEQPEFYHGWPTVTRRRSGDLWLVWSGGRDAHICPFGKVESMVSHDSGATWTWPRTLLDSATDDRDAGVVETARGTLLVTTFTSLAYESALPSADKRWKLAHDRLSPEQRRADLGQWMLRSTDGGATWSARFPSLVNSPHGPIALSDGRLLYAGKELWTGEHRVGACESDDDGQTWRWLGAIGARAGDTIEGYHELHVVEAAEKRLVVHIRNENKQGDGETLQSESEDGGKTWSEPHSIGVWGVPSFLLRLHDGRLLMTYGHRRAPLGNQARLSGDQGRTWSEPLIISGDGVSGDLGYPSTVEMPDGSLLTVWYESMKSPAKAVLRQACWRIDE